MKTNVVLLVMLLVGMGYLVVYGSGSLGEQIKQRNRETDFLRRQQRMLKEMQEEQKPFAEKESTKTTLAKLEARVVDLENALATRLPLSRKGIPRSLRRRFDGELKSQSDKAIAAVQGRVSKRVIKAIEGLEVKKLK